MRLELRVSAEQNKMDKSYIYFARADLKVKIEIIPFQTTVTYQRVYIKDMCFERKHNVNKK